MKVTLANPVTHQQIIFWGIPNSLSVTFSPSTLAELGYIRASFLLADTKVILKFVEFHPAVSDNFLAVTRPNMLADSGSSYPVTLKNTLSVKKHRGSPNDRFSVWLA